MKFRKKPVVIEARQMHGASPELAAWCGGELITQYPEPPYIVIRTLEGNMVADIGDWIIKGIQGEFYHCKPGIFEATYEAVSE